MYALRGRFHDAVTWYGINYAGTQATQWDFQNKGKSGWTGTSSIVLKVPPWNLCPSIIYSVQCDQIVQLGPIYLYSDVETKIRTGIPNAWFISRISPLLYSIELTPAKMRLLISCRFICRTCVQNSTGHTYKNWVTLQKMGHTWKNRSLL